jgi:hypothetical protein
MMRDKLRAHCPERALMQEALALAVIAAAQLGLSLVAFRRRIA